MGDNHEWWREAVKNATTLAEVELVFRKLWPQSFPKPSRRPLFGFPDVVIHAAESLVKKHQDYAAAKSGDAMAAASLVVDALNRDAAESLHRSLHGEKVSLVSAHAFESAGLNAIPEAFAERLAMILGLPVESGIVQINTVGHTGADGFGRLARQPVFSGPVTDGGRYVLVDDFVGMGGTLANLKGFIEECGGIVAGATVLTGKPYSAKIAPSPETLKELREKHGKELEIWWREKFGHTFDCLTQSEARYLLKTENADRIRDRIAAAEQEGDRGSDQGDIPG